MPTSETVVAARDTTGVEVVYRHTTLPSKENVEAYEAFHKGAAGIMLDMAQFDQREHWRVVNRESITYCCTRIMGMTFCFLLCMAMIVGGVWLMATDHYVTGSASVVIALVAVLGSLAVGGRQLPKNNIPEQRERSTP